MMEYTKVAKSRAMAMTAENRMLEGQNMCQQELTENGQRLPHQSVLYCVIVKQHLDELLKHH